MKKYVLLLSLALFVFSSYAQKSDDVIGLWLSQDKDGHIEISKTPEGTFWGKNVWFTVDGVENPDVTDVFNPDPSKRQAPILGLTIMHSFRFEDGKWVDGRVYDPNSGKTYKAKMWFKDGNKDVLVLRGYIGAPLFGRSVEWTRIK